MLPLNRVATVLQRPLASAAWAFPPGHQQGIQRFMLVHWRTHTASARAQRQRGVRIDVEDTNGGTRAALLLSGRMVSFLNRATVASLPGSFWRGLPRHQSQRSGLSASSSGCSNPLNLDQVKPWHSVKVIIRGHERVLARQDRGGDGRIIEAH